MTRRELTLPETVLLLGWDDERGRNLWTQNPAVTMAGATVLELLLRDALTLSEGRLRVGTARTGVSVLDHTLDEIDHGRTPPKIKKAVGRLGSGKWVYREVVDELVRDGILRTERRRVLLWTRTVHPVAAPERAREARERAVRVLTGTAPVDDPRDAALGAIIASSPRILNDLLPPPDRRAARKRARALAKGESMTTEVTKAIAEINTATAAAIAAAGAAGADGGS